MRAWKADEHAMRLAQAVLVATVGGACSASRIPPPDVSPPAVVRPADTIPGDLDVAFRVDLVHARRMFGDRVTRALELKTSDPSVDPAGAKLLVDAIDRADTIWVAFRPGLAPELTDNVTIVRGSFDDLRPRTYGGSSRWGPPQDLGADYRVFRREPTVRRAAPVELYAHSDDLLVFVSQAEIDSAERSIVVQAGDSHVDPPERGTASVAARLPPLVPLIAPHFPVLAEALEEATSLSGHATIDSLGLRGELETKFIDTEGPAKAARAARQLSKIVATDEGPLGMVAQWMRIDAVGTSLILRLNLDASQMGKLVSCAEHGAACAS